MALLQCSYSHNIIGASLSKPHIDHDNGPRQSLAKLVAI